MAPLPYFRKTKVSSSKLPPGTLNTKVTSGGSVVSEDQSNHDDIVTEARFPELGQDYIDGRHYKKSPTALLPCDDEEIERLEIAHMLHKFLFGTTHLSPMTDQLERGIRVLEIACGPAWWSKEMANLYPNSEFIGVDDIMFPIQNPPLNFHAKKIDYTKDLPFPDESFDFVVQHDARFQHTTSTWRKVIEEAIRVTKPGGYIEFLEGGNEMNDIGPNLSLWVMRLTVSMQSRELQSKVGVNLESMFEPHREKVTIMESAHRSAPVGWLGRAGDLMAEVLARLIESVKPRLCEDWTIPPAKYDAWTNELVPEGREFKSWVNVYCISAKKNEPLQPTDEK
ncbi:S-adenosyl-L-methionine-dependent methyltransferase [Gongronella butleri]|nr:S-adenosyl-L-methionine-dependent methyltransferase [Gongronella butleri]